MDGLDEIDQFSNAILTKVEKVQSGWYYASIDHPDDYNTWLMPAFGHYAPTMGDAMQGCANQIRQAWANPDHRVRIYEGDNLIYFWRNK